VEYMQNRKFKSVGCNSVPQATVGKTVVL